MIKNHGAVVLAVSAIGGLAAIFFLDPPDYSVLTGRGFLQAIQIGGIPARVRDDLPPAGDVHRMDEELTPEERDRRQRLRDEFVDLLLMGDAEGLAAMIADGFDPNGRTVDGKPFIVIAVETHNIAIVQALLGDPQLDLNVTTQTGETALFAAVRDGQDAIARLLLEHGASTDIPNAAGDTPLHSALQQDNSAMVEALLEHRANPNVVNQKGVSALQLAVETGRPTLVRQVMIRGADPDMVVTSTGEPLLMWTLGQERLAPLAIDLVRGGASPNSTGPGQKTALMRALERRDLPLAVALCVRGAEVNARDLEGQSALHYAAQQGDLEFMRLLVERRADVDARDRKGRTPLMLAVQREDRDAVRLLLDAGGDPDIRDNEGRTARDAARKIGAEQFAGLFGR